MVSPNTLMDSLYTLHQINFPDFLQLLLEQTGASKAELFNYLCKQGYSIEKTSMYRYFNPNPSVNRMPDETFVALFAQFLELSDEHHIALCSLWRIKRDRFLALIS